MLTTYRRHKKRCEHRKEGRKYRRCQCPVWVDGHLNGVRIHQSLHIGDWQRAQARVREWEAAGEQSAHPELVTIGQACEVFLEDAAARGLREPTIYKYRLLFRRLQEFAQRKGIQLVRQV